MDEYVLGAPLFKKATIKLENGKSFVIEAPNNSGENKYVHHATLGGKIHSLNYITHTDVMKGGTLKLVMRSEPNKSRGTRLPLILIHLQQIKINFNTS